MLIAWTMMVTKEVFSDFINDSLMWLHSNTHLNGCQGFVSNHEAKNSLQASGIVTGATISTGYIVYLLPKLGSFVVKANHKV